MEENKAQNEIFNAVNYCSRCKLKEAEIKCAMCDPYKYFCESCNEYVHSITSKKFHVRRKINDRSLDSLNNIDDSKLKFTQNSNFKLSENFNKEKFSQVIKENQSDIKKALENFEFKYTNNQFNSNDCLDNLENRVNEVSQTQNKFQDSLNNFYQIAKETQINYDRIDRTRLDAYNNLENKTNYSTYNNFNYINPQFSTQVDRDIINSSNNSLTRSKEDYELRGSKNRDNPRRFYNLKRNNTNSEGNFSSSPKVKSLIINSDVNQVIGSNNYLNEIKKIYDKERDELLNKNFESEKKYEELKLISNEEINFLKNKLEDTMKRYESEITKINEDNNLYMKKIINEKDQEIKKFYLRNRDLEQMNEQLALKNNEYSLMIQKIKHGFTDKMSEFDLESRQKDKEIVDLKNYYEDRISKLINSFNLEKSTMISENEKNIEKLTNGYKENKEKLLNLLKEKDEEIIEVESNHKYEQENIESLKKQICNLHNEITKLQETINTLTIQNRNAMELINKHKQDNDFILQEAKKLEDEHEELIKNNEYLKLEHEKLDRLTKGKLTRRSNSKNNSTFLTKNTSFVKKTTSFFSPLLEKIIKN